MVCQECLEKRERSQKKGFSQSKRNLNDNFLTLNAARKVGVNMHLEQKKFSFDPMSVKCNICKGRVENNNLYCLQCAFSKGICESCGKKISDVKMYRQSDIDYKKLKKIKEADRNKQAQSKQNLKTNLDQNFDKKPNLTKLKNEKYSETLHNQRNNINLKIKKVENREEEENNISQDEIDFTKNIDDICNEKTQYEKDNEDIDVDYKLHMKNKSTEKKTQKDKKEKEEDEVELDEDYTEVIKI